MNLENSRAIGGIPRRSCREFPDEYSRNSLAKSQLGRPSPAGRAFVGGYIRRVTPVPIPNTVVKPAEPMILRQRESRSLPALNKNPDHSTVVGVLFCAPLPPPPPHSHFNPTSERPYPSHRPAGSRVASVLRLLRRRTGS